MAFQMARRPAAARPGVHADTPVERVLRSPGQRLDGNSRAAMESYLGHDFSRVRIHSGSRAEAAASAIGSSAFTVGQDVVLGASWAPGTLQGLSLLAHELTHVVQQPASPRDPSRPLQLSNTWDPAEREAGAVAAGVASRQATTAPDILARPAGNIVHRQPRPGVEVGHLERNRFNFLPVGSLTPIGDADRDFKYNENGSNSYRDEAGLIWKLLPDSMTRYHQPDGHEKSDHPFPNKKFLHVDSSGGSAEAIRRPDGTYITTGPLRGTYNFVDPQGPIGFVGHGIVDLLPHLIGSTDYAEYPPLDPRKVDVDTYRARFEAQIEPIGKRTETNVTDPVDRTVVVETGVIWITHPAGEVLVLAEATNGRLRFVRFIEAAFQAEAIGYGQTRQPRGIQHIPGTPPYIFDVPATVPADVARRPQP